MPAGTAAQHLRRSTASSAPWSSQALRATPAMEVAEGPELVTVARPRLGDEHTAQALDSLHAEYASTPEEDRAAPLEVRRLLQERGLGRSDFPAFWDD